MILAVTDSFLDSVIELVAALVIFLFVLALTYYVTRWIAGYQRTKTAQGNISMIEVQRVANNQYIQLVRAGKDKYLVIGSTKDRMTLLATLTEEELRTMPEPVASAPVAGKGFSDILEDFKKKHAK